MDALGNCPQSRSSEYLHGGRKGCLEGTREAVLNEIGLWAGDFDKPPVYWLNGLAGTGKSAVAQTISERLAAEGRLGASFFCSRDFKDRSDLKLIFSTIAVQLAHKYTKFRSILVPLIGSNPDIIYESLSRQMEKLIVQPLGESGVSTVIVIDALDECKDYEPFSAILSALGQFVSHVPKVKFFLTGRPEQHICQGFRHPPLAAATHVFVLHEVEPGRVDDDIRLFFGREFSEIAGRRGGLDNWLNEENLDLLCERAAGLFGYAVATVKFADSQDYDPREQLDLILQSPENSAYEGETIVDGADATLDSIYMSILREGFSDHCTEIDLEVRSILGTVVLASNPVSPSTIAALLDLDTGTVFSILSSAHSLLVLQEDADHTVRSFHKSFPDFIVDPTRCTDQRFHISPPHHHSELLIGCLELMNWRLEENMYKLPDGVANSEVDDLGERAEQYIDHGLRYACESWHKLLVYESTTHTPKVFSALRRFLRDKFLFWLEVLSVLGRVGDAVHALEATKKWLNEVRSVSDRDTWPMLTQTRSIHWTPLPSLTTAPVS